MSFVKVTSSWAAGSADWAAAGAAMTAAAMTTASTDARPTCVMIIFSPLDLADATARAPDASGTRASPSHLFEALEQARTISVAQIVFNANREPRAQPRSGPQVRLRQRVTFDPGRGRLSTGTGTTAS